MSAPMTTWYKVDKNTFEITPVQVSSENTIRIRIGDSHTGRYVGIDSEHRHYCKTWELAKAYALKLVSEQRIAAWREFDRLDSKQTKLVELEAPDGG